jgi:hypothetical protein
MAVTSIPTDPTLASRYLAGQLTDSECRDYEARLLEDPATVLELEATARVKVGLERLRDTGDLPRALHRPAIFRSQFIPTLAAAGVAAVAIGIAVWAPRSRSHAPPTLASSITAFQDRSGHGLPLAATQAVFRTRAEAYDALIELPAARAVVQLRVLPAKTDLPASYELSLSRVRDDDSLQEVAVIGNLQPAADDGFVSVYADSSQLAPGRYRMTLARKVQSKSPPARESFLIKVVRGEPLR